MTEKYNVSSNTLRRVCMKAKRDMSKIRDNNIIRMWEIDLKVTDLGLSHNFKSQGSDMSFNMQ